MSTIDAFNYLIKVALNYDIPKLEHARDYFKLLNMLKYVEIKGKCKIRLLVIIFEKMFINNSKIIITKKAEVINQYISFCNAHIIPKKIKNGPYLATILNLFKFIEVQEDEILLIYHLMISNKRPSLYYRIIDALFSAKNEKYITNEEIKIDDNINYVTFIQSVINSIVKYKKENNNSHFIFDYKNNEFIIKKLSKEEAEKYKNDHPQLKHLNPDELLDFIKEHSKPTNIQVNDNKVEEISDELIEININSMINNVQEEINEPNKIQEREINIYYEQELQMLKEEICELKNYRIVTDKEISELKNYKISADKEMTELNKEISELKNYRIEADKKICESKEEIARLNNIIKAMKEDSGIKESNFTKILEEINQRHNNSISELKKDIEEIKEINNSLNMKLINLNKKNEKLVLNVINNSKLDKNNLIYKSKEDPTINNKINIKFKLIIKLVIDFIYSILSKKYDISLKFED